MIDNRDSLRGLANLAQAFAEKRKQEERASLRNQAMQAIMGAADAYRAAVDTPYAQKYGADDLMSYAGAMEERRQQEEKARQQAAQQEQMRAFANQMRDPSYNYRDARTVIPSLIEYAAMGGNLDALSPNLRHWVAQFATDRVDLGDRQQIVNTDPMTGESKISYDQKKGLAPARPRTGGSGGTGGSGKPVLRTINGELVQVFPDGTVVPIYGEKKQQNDRYTYQRIKQPDGTTHVIRINQDDPNDQVDLGEAAGGNDLVTAIDKLIELKRGGQTPSAPAPAPKATQPAPQAAPAQPVAQDHLEQDVKDALAAGDSVELILKEAGEISPETKQRVEAILKRMGR